MRCSQLGHHFLVSKMIEQACPFKHTKDFQTQIYISKDEKASSFANTPFNLPLEIQYNL